MCAVGVAGTRCQADERSGQRSGGGVSTASLANVLMHAPGAMLTGAVSRGEGVRKVMKGDLKQRQCPCTGANFCSVISEPLRNANSVSLPLIVSLSDRGAALLSQLFHRGSSHATTAL